MTSESSMMFVGSFVNAISLKKTEFIHEGILVVTGKKISHFQKNLKNQSEIHKQYKVQDKDVHTMGKGQFMIPGFVDTHFHGPQYPNIGLGYNLPFLEWLRTYTFPLEKRFSDEKFAEKVYNVSIHVFNQVIYCAFGNMNARMVYPPNLPLVVQNALNVAFALKTSSNWDIRFGSPEITDEVSGSLLRPIMPGLLTWNQPARYKTRKRGEEDESFRVGDNRLNLCRGIRARKFQGLF